MTLRCNALMAHLYTFVSVHPLDNGDHDKAVCLSGVACLELASRKFVSGQDLGDAFAEYWVASPSLPERIAQNAKQRRSKSKA